MVTFIFYWTDLFCLCSKSLGIRTLVDLGQAALLGSKGEHGWLGVANTYYWIDPQEKLIGILMKQFQPSGFYTVSADFRTLAYQAIAD